jgi:hypothetical protein
MIKYYAENQIKRSFIRKFIRSFYFKNILRYVEGPAIDFGCGSGDFLSLLPKGSIGFEINDFLVNYCTAKGLEVYKYNPEEDDYNFYNVNHGKFITFIMAHVLEHISEPFGTLRKIFSSCHRIGIKRIIIVVPGLKGFYSDKTHSYFIDLNFLKRFNGLEGYNLKLVRYFPFNFWWAGRFFTHNELLALFCWTEDE